MSGVFDVRQDGGSLTGAFFLERVCKQQVESSCSSGGAIELKITQCSAVLGVSTSEVNLSVLESRHSEPSRFELADRASECCGSDCVCFMRKEDHGNEPSPPGC